jgi:hypothetical protein
MTHQWTIYGMAKSYLDLKGAKCRGFELDFLRLALVADRDANCKAAYLSAPLPKSTGLEIVQIWNQKYGLSKVVIFVPTELDETEMRLLQVEKTGNRNANRTKGNKQAGAGYGEKLIEGKLMQHIQAHHPGIIGSTHREAHYLPGIRWDYFGTITA